MAEQTQALWTALLILHRMFQTILRVGDKIGSLIKESTDIPNVELFRHSVYRQIMSVDVSKTKIFKLPFKHKS